MPRAGEPGKAHLLLFLEEQSPDLAFTIECWDLAARDPRVVGRAAELAIAEAIFLAAVRDHPGSAIVLRQGLTVLRRSGH